MYLEHILAQEVPAVMDEATCGHELQWRCVSCVGAPTFCTTCCRNDHKRHVFHRIERWQGDFFQAAALLDVGVHVHLGHGGDPCPQLQKFELGVNDYKPPDEADDAEEEPEQIPTVFDRFAFWDDETAERSDIPIDDADLPQNASIPPIADPLPFYSPSRRLTIVHTNGIHDLHVTFCQCENAASEDLQLLDGGFYPGSFKRPVTAFTFQVLDDYLLTNRECKTSPLRYFYKLRKLTNSALPHTVQVSAHAGVSGHSAAERADDSRGS